MNMDLDRAKRRKYCGECRDNFYNGNNDLGIRRCWHLEGSRVVNKNVYFNVKDAMSAKTRTLDCFRPQT